VVCRVTSCWKSKLLQAGSCGLVISGVVIRFCVVVKCRALQFIQTLQAHSLLDRADAETALLGSTLSGLTRRRLRAAGVRTRREIAQQLESALSLLPETTDSFDELVARPAVLKSTIHHLRALRSQVEAIVERPSVPRCASLARSRRPMRRVARRARRAVRRPGARAKPASDAPPGPPPPDSRRKQVTAVPARSSP